MFDQSVIDAARQHGIEAYPRESCGLVVDGTYLPCANVAEVPEEAFEIAKKDWQRGMASGTIDAVIHSHPDGPACPTAADMRGQMQTAIPWGIFESSVDNAKEPFWFGDQVPIDEGPAGSPPIVGRYFRHAVTDCYDVIRDWWRLERGVLLPNFPRDWEWWLPEVTKDGRGIARVKNGRRISWTHDEQEFAIEGPIDRFPVEHAGFVIEAPENLYADNFEVAGFHEIDEREVDVGDCFLANIGTKTPNHGGVYVGNGLGLHHLTARRPVDYARIAKRDPIARWSSSYISVWLRYDGHA